MSGHRKIIHVDMDAFFASVEQRDAPELRGKPLVVGGKSRRSVVAAASYEARVYGIFSAMPMALAKQKCPHLVVVPHRFDVYKDVSRQICDVFRTYTDLVEPLSLDEAYLDVTENKMSIGSATNIGKEIKALIYQKTNLTCSAGISVNKFLAKIASDLNKPDGLTVIKPHEVDAFVKELAIEKFFGVGKATLAKMHKLGVHKGEDLQQFSEIQLVKVFGKVGRYYYKVCRGLDDRLVKPSRERKSISVERTFEQDIKEESEALEIIEKLTKRLAGTLKTQELIGKTVHLKWRYPDFVTPTRSKTFSFYTDDHTLIFQALKNLAVHNIDLIKGVRLLGVGVSNLNTIKEVKQLSLDI
ncbi:MAG: DNA polymerase IV [Saprospiraceae bacterium]|nr:DNA polymerase IV [Saprospiraceae bacterium]